VKAQAREAYRGDDNHDHGRPGAEKQPLPSTPHATTWVVRLPQPSTPTVYSTGSVPLPLVLALEEIAVE
jgi:hypothetical protein